MTLGGGALTGIDPPHVIEGARLWVRGADVPPVTSPDAVVHVGSVSAQIAFAAPDRVAVIVPQVPQAGRTTVRAAWSPGATLFVDVGVSLATGLHQVDSPVFDGTGRLYATFSGSRGQEAGVSVYRIGSDGAREAFVEGIVNATSLAMSPDGVLHVSSRYDGIVYRIDDEGRWTAMATDLGVACGLAFAPDGSLFVGDRMGAIRRVPRDGSHAETFATLPASIAAFHLAFGPDEMLYATAPTLATHDAVYRIDASGRVEVLDRTFGRPQGLAFDAGGVLHVVEALAGVSAIFRLDAGGPRRAVVGGPGLVGVAFGPSGELVAATADSVYRFAATP